VYRVALRTAVMVISVPETLRRLAWSSAAVTGVSRSPGRPVELHGQDPPGSRAEYVDPGGGQVPAGLQRLAAGHLHDGLMPGNLRCGAGEAETGLAPHQAPPSIAAGQPARPDLAAVRHRDRDGVLTALESGDLGAAPDLHPEFSGVLTEYPLHPLLPDEGAGPGRPMVGELGIGDVDQVGIQPVAGEVPGQLGLGRPGRGCLGLSRVGRVRETLTQEGRQLLLGHPLRFGQGGQQTPPVERLDRRHVQRPRLDRRVDFGAPLEDHDRRATQPELTGQHQADRPATGHDHVGVDARWLPERC
jgi:hypothetical protein